MRERYKAVSTFYYPYDIFTYSTIVSLALYGIIRAKRVSNCYIQEKKKMSVCVDVRLILVLMWKKIVLVLAWGTSERLVPAKKNRTPGTSERFVANCGVGPSTRGQGDSASLVKLTQDQRR